jgi:hypothetical protein
MCLQEELFRQRPGGGRDPILVTKGSYTGSRPQGPGEVSGQQKECLGSDAWEALGPLSQ